MNQQTIQTTRRNMKHRDIKSITLAELQLKARDFNTAVIKQIYIGAEKVEDKEHFAIWNEQQEHVSAVVSGRYNLVQHQHVINEVTEALRNLNIKTEALVNTSGDVLICDLQFSDTMLDIKKGEEFFTGMRVINSYNKTTGIMVLPRLTRVVCSNGMVVESWVKGFNVAHTSKLAEDFAKEIPALIQRMVSSDEKLKAYLDQCLADSIEWEAATHIIKNLFKTDKHSDAILAILKKAQAAAQPSRWEIYNAITNYCSFNDQLSPSMEQGFQNKAQQVLTTPLQQLVPVIEEATL